VRVQLRRRTLSSAHHLLNPSIDIDSFVPEPQQTLDFSAHAQSFATFGRPMCGTVSFRCRAAVRLPTSSEPCTGQGAGDVSVRLPYLEDENPMFHATINPGETAL